MSDRYMGRGPARRSPPPRDRLPPRDRDDHPDVEYFGAGESYRPGGSTGEGPYRPNRDRDRGDYWGSERRDDRRREDIDSYIPPTSSRAQRQKSRSPGGYRRRSRSPLDRSRTELFPERTRTPPRRYSPRRDDRPRSPARRRSRSPYTGRARSPGMSRAKDSPRGRSSSRNRFDRPRSPPRRNFSPPRGGSYRRGSRSPPRRDDVKPSYASESWRRRSPSPRASGSADTSRRSSPPVHPDRTSIAGSGPQSPAYGSRNAYDSRRDDLYSRPRSPRNDYGEINRDMSPSRDDFQKSEHSTAPPSGPRSTAYGRPPPSGPSRNYTQPSQTSPPTGPSSSQISTSAYNRGPSPSVSSAPTGPRGTPSGRFEGPSRDFNAPPGAMRGRTSLTYRAPGYRAPSYSDIPPSGPRATSYSRGDFGSSTRGDYGSSGRGDFAGRGDYGSSGRGDFSGRGDYGSRGDYNSNRGSYGGYGRGSYSQDFSFRGSNNSSSTTYPRTQRFNTTQQHLSTLEKVVPGGKKLPSGLSADQEKRMKQLEEDAEKLRGELNDKQKSKREAINEWEVRERESELAGLRSELAEDHLRKLTEEDAIASAAF